MSSFWIVSNGQAVEHVGRPTHVGNTSFAIGCSDATYLAAGLYLHVDWTGGYDPRTQIMSVPQFVVNESTKEVRVEYNITEKTVEQVAAYDAEQAALLVEAEAEAARIAASIAAKEELALGTISGMTYAELETYINNNVTDLPSARIYLKRLSRVVKALVDRGQDLY